MLAGRPLFGRRADDLLTAAFPVVFEPAGAIRRVWFTLLFFAIAAFLPMKNDSNNLLEPN
jgi:hypothetical protein